MELIDGTPPAGRHPLRLDRPAALARAGSACGRRGLRALPGGCRGPAVAGLPGPGPSSGRPVRHLRGRDPRRRPCDRGRRSWIRHHERGQAVRLRPGLPGPRPRRGQRPAGDERHRAAFQLARGRRARPRRPHQPDGQPWGDRHRQSGTWPRRRGPVGVSPRRAVAVRGPAAVAGRGGLCLGVGHQHRNRALANLLESYGRLGCDPVEAVDLYTRQSCLRVSVTELAVMGATLANGGVNPLTGERVVDAAVCHFTLAVMTTAGLYETSGDWLYDVGVPGKSGIGGGIVVVSPGKGALATFAPPLDGFGNSVKGQLAARFLSRRLGLTLFASEPAT